MAFELSVKANLLRQQTNIETQLIVEIEDIPLIYGAVTVTKLAKYGDSIKYGDSGLVYGGSVSDENGRAYISLKGTTNNITQQLEIDKGGVGSVQKFNVTFVDKNQEVTDAFTPGNIIDDLLTKEANVFIAFAGASHPEDSIRIFNGTVTSMQGKPGSWRIGIDHPDSKKRVDIFQQITSDLDTDIGSIDTSLILDSVSGLIEPADAVASHVQIEDEIIQYAGITTSTNTLTGLTRGALGTAPVGHTAGAAAVSYYTLTGDPIELALKMMLSNEGNLAFKTDVPAQRFVQVTVSETIANGIFFEDNRIKENLGLELGDLISTSGDPNGANNFTDGVIQAFVSVGTGTAIVVTGPTLVSSVASPALADFKSQYNLLPTGAGCGMKPSQVDVKQHVDQLTLFPTLPEYKFKLKDTVTAKDFISTQIYFPAGFYQVPRKGRSSVNSTIPPLATEALVELTDDNVKNASQNQITRSITKNFYNNIVYKYDRDALSDRFLKGSIVFSTRSTNRLKTGNKSLTIESDGLQGTPSTATFITSQIRRFSDRYQFAAESISVDLNYKTGFPIEIGDVVLFGNSNLKIPDLNEGSRDFKPRLMEVVQKDLDIRGKVRIGLLDTGFAQDGNFRVISPNSFTDSGSTTTNLKLKTSFATGEFELERNKWENMVGEEIRIRNIDFTFEETRTLIQFDPGSLNGIIIDPALSVPPPEDYLIDLPEYPDTATASDNSKMKTLYAFFNPQVDVVTGIDDFSFTVAPADIDKFLVGAFLLIHTDDYTDTSTPGIGDDDVKVLTVDSGTFTVTVDKSMGFTPAVSYRIDLIGFKDGGLPYRVL